MMQTSSILYLSLYPCALPYQPAWIFDIAVKLQVWHPGDPGLRPPLLQCLCRVPIQGVKDEVASLCGFVNTRGFIHQYFSQIWHLKHLNKLGQNEVSCPWLEQNEVEIKLIY